MEDKDIIKFGNKEFKSSLYQKEIFTEIEQGCNNMVITAAAGSAKTTTIENCLRFIPKDKKCLFLAFNRSTVGKLKEEIETSLSNVKIMTFHGLGFRLLSESNVIASNGDIIDDYKYINFVKNNILELSSTYESLSKLDKIQYIDNINKLINYSRYYISMTIKEIGRTAQKYGIIPIDDEYSVVRKVLIWGKNSLEKIDHTDMIWLPNVLNLEPKFLKFDFIFIDEAQDTTMAHQSMVDKCFKRSARFIAVGDIRQQINVWCGATEQAIEEYKKRPNTKQISLPISYRCPKAIVNKAKQFASNIEAATDAIEGEIRYDVSYNDAKEGDLILCRVISKLVETYLNLLRNNKKAYLKGSEEVKEKCINYINASQSKLIDYNCITKDGLLPTLYNMFFEKKNKIMAEFNLEEEETIYHSDLVEMYDCIEVIKTMAEGLTTVEELLEKFNVIFNNGNTDGIQLSTIHKAKGLEADNVFILAHKYDRIKFCFLTLIAVNLPLIYR